MKLKKLGPLPIFFAVETSHVKLIGHNPFTDILLKLEDNEREKARKDGKKALEDAESEAGLVGEMTNTTKKISADTSSS
ncbi:hypothetical protein YC2023_116763 [Brassica napus]